MGRLQRIIDPTDPLIRYLLNDISDEERYEIEEQLKNDEKYRTRLAETEEQLIIAYANAGLSKTNIRLFKNNFLCTDERWKKVELIQKYESSITPPSHIFNPIYRFFALSTTTRLLLGVSLFILLPVITIFVWDLLSVKRGEWALIDAYARERPVEARITGFSYAIFSRKRNNQPLIFDEVKRRKAQNLITSHDNGHNNSFNTLIALGKLALTGKEFDTAIKYFNLALKKNYNDAETHNNIAVALIAKERAKDSDENNAEGYAEASEHLHKAIELDASLMDAQFNLALCRQYQMLWRTAAESWKQYLEKDSHSQWAEEARKNLKDIEEKLQTTVQSQEKIIKEFPEILRSRDPERAWNAYKNSRTSSGSFVLEKIIDDYLTAKSTNNTTVALDTLQSLLFMGQVELNKTGDEYTQYIAQYYRTASLDQLSRSTEARRLFKIAYDQMLKTQHGVAIENSKKALGLFKDIGNEVEALLVQCLLGYLHFRLGDAQVSLNYLTQGAEECKTRSYKWLWGLYQNSLFNVEGMLTKYTKAEEHNKNYIANSRFVEDDRGLLHGLGAFSELSIYLGDYQSALISVQKGLSLASRTGVPISKYIALYKFGAVSLMGQGKLFGAFDYQMEGVKASSEVNIPWISATHYSHLAEILNEQDRHDEAIDWLRKVTEIAKHIPDNKLSKQILARAFLFMGKVFRDMGRWEDSDRYYQNAEQLYKENEIENILISFEINKGRFLTAVKRNDYETGERALRNVLEQYESHRVNIEYELSRSVYFNKEQNIYDTATEFAYYQLQDIYRAFEYAELSRARSLLDILELHDKKITEGPIPNIYIPYSVKPLSLNHIQERMPDKTQLIQYAVLDDRLIIWVVSKDALNSNSIDIPKNTLNNKVNFYLSQIEASQHSPDSTEYKQVSTELYEILIKPVEKYLKKAHEICIIPDKFLNRLPFASLINSDTGRYFIEDRVLYMSPSANIFIAATDNARKKELVKEEKLLAIGPVTNKSIPDAQSQTIGISSLYKSGITLLGQDSKESLIRRQLKQADVVDFANHYIADERSPMLSYLPLAYESGSFTKIHDGKLHTYELYDMKLSRLRLVVLSACQTGIERYYDGEGSIGLARAFLAIGVPLVVASLWSVEDYPIKVMMLLFHKHRKLSNQSSANALRLAQLDMIKNTDPRVNSPYHWAAYTVFGGHSSY